MPGNDRVKEPKRQKEPAPRPRGAQRSPGAGSRSRGAGAKGAVKAAPQEPQAIQEEPRSPTRSPLPRLLHRYREEVRPQLMREFGYRNVMEAPAVKKVVVNIGLAEALQNARALEAASGHLATITGQRPVTTRARKSIANFKLRKGMTIGAMVTLRSARMYDFLDRLVNMALPRIRDFRGTSRNSFDGQGNYSLGLREQAIFPEIDYNEIDRIRGLQVSIVTSAGTDGEALRLLELLGMPFVRDGGVAAASRAGK